MDFEAWIKWIVGITAGVVGFVSSAKIIAKARHSSSLQKYKIEELEKEMTEVKATCEKLREHSQGYDIFKSSTGAQLSAMNRTLEVISLNQIESQKILLKIFSEVTSPKR